MDNLPTSDPRHDPKVVTRIAWLHFANDFTLDFITPLLPSGVGVAWLGIMEGAADGIGQILRMVTGRASDRSGRRTPWVRSGYLVNAVARPLTAVGMVCALPWWIICCRIGDRIGKGLRGSATDALLADWTDGPSRPQAFNRMRTMDHLGATLGGLAAAAAAWILAPQDLWLAVASLVMVTLWVAWLTRGLRDVPFAVSTEGTIPSMTGNVSVGWWPRAQTVQRPLIAIALATLATKISPLVILVQVAGLPAEGGSDHWPLWQVCLGWAVLGMVQAGASSFAGMVSSRLGPAWMLRAGWITTVVVFAGIAFASGPWLIAVGLAFGVLAGLTEGSEKALLADLAPRNERGVTYGAMALLTAITGLVGNALGGLLLVWWGPWVFLVLAAGPLAALMVLGKRISSDRILP